MRARCRRPSECVTFELSVDGDVLESSVTRNTEKEFNQAALYYIQMFGWRSYRKNNLPGLDR